MQLITSVSGIRGIVGETLTPSVAVDAGCAFASFAGRGTIIVGRDSRVSGEMIKSAVISGLLACGCDVVDIGICTTPTTALTVAHRKAAGGIMITASHNPAPWNGIKFFSADAVAPPKPIVEPILDRFRDRDFALVPATEVGSMTCDDTATAHHVNTVLGTVDADAIRARRFKVVLDSVNGGGGPAGRQLLDALGCEVTHVNGEPTGRFAHTPEPIAENLTDLCDQTRNAGAAIGFAQDPDADRLAIVDENGRYIGEEYTLVLAAWQTFATRPGPACANLSTSRMIDDVAARFEGCPVHRSKVGEANVADVMKAQHCVVGGEGNGGVIDPRVVYVRDSLVAMALVLQLMTSQSRPISALVDDIPRYASIKQKFECNPQRTAAVLAAVREAFQQERISDVDGIRIDWDRGWVHVRGSNTEPIMRVVCEAADTNTGEALIARVREVVDAVPG
jgi:phosphomannomutase